MASDETAANPRPPEITGHIFERHVFICTSGDNCPALDGDGLGVHARFKRLVAQAGLAGRVRVNHSGCLDQCGHGPMVVIYPDNVWYWGVEPDDVDEIVRSHLIGGEPVARQLILTGAVAVDQPRDEHKRPIGRPARPPAEAT